MQEPIFRCSIDGKTKYLTRDEFYAARRIARLPKYCIMGEKCGTRFYGSDTPRPISDQQKEGVTNV